MMEDEKSFLMIELEFVKELRISGQNQRSGTAAGDVQRASGASLEPFDHPFRASDVNALENRLFDSHRSGIRKPRIEMHGLAPAGGTSLPQIAHGWSLRG